MNIHIVALGLIAFLLPNCACTTFDNQAPDVETINSDIELLQGSWNGVYTGDSSRQQITLTVTNNNLHFHQDEDYWFKTTFKLLPDEEPKQFHATINESADGISDGEIVGSIFRIENEMLTLAVYDLESFNPDKSISDYPSRYVFYKGSKDKLINMEGNETFSTPMNDQENYPRDDSLGIGVLLQ